MEEVGIFEARNSLSALLDRVEQGEEIMITRNGKPVARLVAPTDDAVRQRRREAMRKMLELRNSIAPDALEGTSIRELIEEGRR